jgi:hypothetical protein
LNGRQTLTPLRLWKERSSSRGPLRRRGLGAPMKITFYRKTLASQRI